MNLNAEDEDSFFTQHCLELANLLRTEQTEEFLRLYDSLPAEWTGLRDLKKLNEEYLQLEAAKEHIRQLQELDENDFQRTYQRALSSRDTHQSNIMSNLPRQQQQSVVLLNESEPIITSNSRITSLPILQQKQHIERQTANNLACDEKHDISLKHSSSVKRNNEESNTKTRRLQPITNNNHTTNEMTQTSCRTRTPVDSFVQLNLKPAIDITVEDYKKTRISMPSAKNSGSNHQSLDINESNPKDVTQSIYLKKSKTSMENKSHEEASFDYFSKTYDDDDRQHSRSSSPSSSSSSSTTTSPNPYAILTTNETDLSINPRSNSSEHGKLISTNGFDSHGSSIETKSSSNNSGSARTASCSDSDGEHHHQQQPLPPPLPTKSLFHLTKANLFHNDNTPTMVLSQTSDYRASQYDRISPLPKQDSYELVQLNTENNERHLLASQIARMKLPATDDPSDIGYSNNDILSHTTQQNNTTSTSSHQNRHNEHPEQYNTNHSNSTRKSSSRRSKRRKQLQNQETIRTELIPGHRGDLDVDALVMFIDGHSSPKQQQNSASLRPTDANKFKSVTSIPDSNSNHQSKSRRKSRKPIKILPNSTDNPENTTAPVDGQTQGIGYIDEDDETTKTTTTTHSITSGCHSLPNDEESHSNTIDIDSTNESNTTNGETSLPEWLEPTESTSPAHDDTDSFSLSSTILNNSNSEITSEPFVTVTHRRRLTKERRQDNNTSFGSQSSRLIPSSNTNDKRRFPPSSTTNNGNPRSTTRTTLSNPKPFVSNTPKEENTTSPSSQAISQPQPAPPLPNNSTEQSPSHLSSHSSSSSLVSSVKRQSKPPPVVFLNKSVDIELNDVSFGFDVEKVLLNKPSTPPPPPPISVEKETESLSPTQSTDQSTSSKSSFPSRRSYQSQQRNNRGPLFYSGTDIRPPHQRNYPSQQPVSQSSYIDPYLLLQYNQQRYAANYSQQLAYINLVRAQYLSSQSPYILIPTAYPPANAEEKTVTDDGDENMTNQPSEPLLVYATLPAQPGSIYLQPTKKSYQDLEQTSQPTIPTIYPSQYFYSNQTPPQIIPAHPAYFQPIPSASFIDKKSQLDQTDDDDEEHHDYEKVTRTFHPTRQQSSSHIMSNALQLVYSQEKRNAQTDRFNLDQLTAYLAMKWTENIDHYEKGDDQILLVEE